MESPLQRILGIGVLAIVAMLLVAPGAAFASWDFGGAAGSGATGPACTAATNCDFFQYGDPGGLYTAPQDGVITRFSMRTGSSFTGPNLVQLRIYRPVPPSSWQIIGESPAQALNPLGNTLDVMTARIMVQTGDRLGLWMSSGGDTAVTDANPLWSLGTVLPHPAVGDTVVPSDITATAGKSLNVAVRLEDDADGDGYGDRSQDLCTGNPDKNTQGCSGTTFGSTFQNPTVRVNAGVGGSCGITPNCLIFNTALTGASAVAPHAGVIVRWRVRSEPISAQLKLSVLHPDSPTSLRVTGESSPVEQFPGVDPTIVGETRIPIAAGDFIALSSSVAESFGYYRRAGAGTYSILNPAPAIGGTGAPLAAGADFVDLLYNADVEPDVDGDGYGDQTQDACPQDAADQGSCLAPAISGLTAANKKFRVDPKGAAVSAKSKPGTIFSFDLSRVSTVKYVVSTKKKGKRKGKGCVKKTAKNSHAKSCNYYSVVHFFSRPAVVGANKLAYSGRYMRGTKAKSLTAGSYLLTATPTSVASALTGTSAQVGFKVAKR